MYVSIYKAGVARKFQGSKSDMNSFIEFILSMNTERNDISFFQCITEDVFDIGTRIMRNNSQTEFPTNPEVLSLLEQPQIYPKYLSSTKNYNCILVYSWLH